jgi:hypothetical protein
MGRFNRIPLFTGTLDEFCIYQRGGRYYFRSRSSLTAERVKTDPAFAKTRYYAGLMAKASGIGSILYNALPVQYKKYPLYRKLTGEALIWLKHGWSAEEVLSWMQQRLTPKLAVYRRRRDPGAHLTTMACRQLLPKKEPEEMDEDTYWLKRRSRWLLPRLRKGDWSMLEDLGDQDEDEIWQIKPPERKRSPG